MLGSFSNEVHGIFFLFGFLYIIAIIKRLFGRTPNLTDCFQLIVHFLPA
jgi:hypothetical protein